jgi:hypothetical protein
MRYEVVNNAIVAPEDALGCACRLYLDTPC